MDFWAEAKRLSYVMSDTTFLQYAAVLGFKLPNVITRAEFRDLYRAEVCDYDGWPSALPLIDGKRIAEGLIVKSLSGTMEGRTTGNRRKCIATSTECPGWFIEVIWESGQRLWPCSEGWHFDPDTKIISVVGGGEISARFVSPKPLGTHPAPRNTWPSKKDLMKMRGWRAHA